MNKIFWCIILIMDLLACFFLVFHLEHIEIFFPYSELSIIYLMTIKIIFFSIIPSCIITSALIFNKVIGVLLTLLYAGLFIIFNVNVFFVVSFLIAVPAFFICESNLETNMFIRLFPLVGLFSFVDSDSILAKIEKLLLRIVTIFLLCALLALYSLIINDMFSFITINYSMLNTVLEFRNTFLGVCVYYMLLPIFACVLARCTFDSKSILFFLQAPFNIFYAIILFKIGTFLFFSFINIQVTYTESFLFAGVLLTMFIWGYLSKEETVLDDLFDDYTDGLKIMSVFMVVILVWVAMLILSPVIVFLLDIAMKFAFWVSGILAAFIVIFIAMKILDILGAGGSVGSENLDATQYTYHTERRYKLTRGLWEDD